MKFCGECGAPLGARRRRPCPFDPRRSGAAACLRPLRRPRRLHPLVRGPRPGGRPRAPLALLRHGGRGHRAVRRDGREVHRRRRDGGVGRAGRPRGRRRAGGPRRARPGRPPSLSCDAGARAARGPASSPARRPSHSGPTTRGWSRATSSTPPPGSSRSPRPGPSRRRAIRARDRGGRDRLRARGRARAEGQERTGAACSALRVVGDARGERPVGRRWSRPSSGARRSSACVKELFHATAERAEGAASSPSSGPPASASRGSPGSSRSTSTGSTERVWWHRGRCLAYGEGVASGRSGRWSAGARDRSRRGRRAGDRSKLRAPVERYVPDAEERAWIEPRLRAPARPRPSAPPRDREDLFSAWRRSSSGSPSAGPSRCVFEDLHWADAACSTSSSTCSSGRGNHPIFVLTLARPELLERRPSWGGRARNSTFALPRAAVDDADERAPRGLVPGLPESCRVPILERAEGVPLYAVETVRMLLDRGCSRGTATATGHRGDRGARGPGYAARARRRPPGRSRARGASPLQDASVLGKSFTHAGPAASRASERPSSRSLTRAGPQGDPRAPGRSRLARARPVRASSRRCSSEVAYDTLRPSERKARHLAAAEYLGRPGERASRRSSR